MVCKPMMSGKITQESIGKMAMHDCEPLLTVTVPVASDSVQLKRTATGVLTSISAVGKTSVMVKLIDDAPREWLISLLCLAFAQTLVSKNWLKKNKHKPNIKL